MRCRSAFTMMVITLLMLWTSFSAAADSLADPVRRKIEEIRGKVKSEKTYKPGDEISLTLTMGEAYRLKCGDNACGVKEVLIYADGAVLFQYVLFADGKLSGGGRRLSEGAFWSTSYAGPIAVKETWATAAGKVLLKYQIITNADEIVREGRSHLKKVHEREAKLAAEPIDPDEAVAGFVRLWSEVKYNFAFFDHVPEVNWDKILDEYLPKIRAAKTTAEYYRLLQRCMALLKDGHTDVSPPWFVEGNAPPLIVEPVEGKAIVTKLAGIPALAACGMARGTEITHLDGRPVADILREDIYPYLCASTPQNRDNKAFWRLLDGPWGSAVTIRFRTAGGKAGTVTLTRESAFIPDWPPRSRPVFEIRDLPDGILYVALNRFDDRDVVDCFDREFARIRRAKGLIIDVRVNGGGNSSNGDAIIGRLIDKPVPDTLWKTRQYMPAFRAWGRKEQWYRGEAGHLRPRGPEQYTGPVVILIGPKTGSAAEDFLVPLHAAKRVTLVGQPTAGTTGQPLSLDLPRGGSARICTRWCWYPDGREFVGVGVLPDVEAHPTPKDIAESRDPVLERGLEVLGRKIAKSGP
jgi:carboxyl-terminal processing protease